MRPNKQVSPVIRISQGERDASARATHLEAATGKFLVATNERKQMSTKTNFKRIALVAVAALGLGVLSLVPVQATPAAITVDVVDGTATTALSDSTTAASVTIKGLLGVTATDSISVLVAKKSGPSTASSVLMPILTYVDTVSGGVVGEIEKADGVTDASGWSQATTGVDSATPTSPLHITSAASNTYNGFTAYLYIDTASLTVATRVNTALVAGTYVYTIIATPLTCAASGGCTAGTAVTKDVSIVVAATADASKTAVAGGSFAFISGVTTTKTSSVAARADSAISVVSTASASNIGFIYVGNRNAAGSHTVAQDSLTATVTGPGVVGDEAGSVFGKSIKVAATGDYEFKVRNDGTAGTSTITITSSVTGLTYVKTLTFYSATAKTITATVAAPLLKLGANDKAARGVALDANGAQWAGKAYIVASSAADALVAGSTTPVECTYSPTDLRHDCNVAAIAVGSAKLKIIDAATVALATATSNEITVTVQNAVIADVKISFDKATYAPNERARIYVTPVDAAGKEMQAGAYTNVFTSTGITVNGALSYTGTATTADSMTAAGSFTSASIASSTSGAKAGSFQFTVYMPSAGGVVTLTALGGTGLALANQGKTITASATVTDSGAAALAAVTALATTVASLKTLITTLTNLVLKIQKKVKA